MDDKELSAVFAQLLYACTSRISGVRSLFDAACRFPHTGEPGRDAVLCACHELHNRGPLACDLVGIINFKGKSYSRCWPSIGTVRDQTRVREILSLAGSDRSLKRLTFVEIYLPFNTQIARGAGGLLEKSAT